MHFFVIFFHNITPPFFFPEFFSGTPRIFFGYPQIFFGTPRIFFWLPQKIPDIWFQIFEYIFFSGYFIPDIWFFFRIFLNLYSKKAIQGGFFCYIFAPVFVKHHTKLIVIVRFARLEECRGIPSVTHTGRFSHQYSLVRKERYLYLHLTYSVGFKSVRYIICICVAIFKGLEQPITFLIW